MMTVTKSEGSLLSCCRWNPKQLGTLATGIFIFLSAGMHLALGLGWSLFVNSPHFRYSWFIGVIVGSILSLPVRHFVPEKFILAGSSVFIFIDGILFASGSHNYDALLAGRYLNGIAVGLATVTFLIYASEVALNSHRGVYLAIEQFSITVGIAIQIFYTSLPSIHNAVTPYQLNGSLDIIFALLAIGSSWLFIESPIDYFRWGDDAAALDCLNRLQIAQGWRTPTNAIFLDLKDYVREQELLSWLESWQRGALPLVKMIFFRSMMLAFSFSLPLNVALELSLVVNLLTWPPTLAACLRIFGGIIAFLLVDNIGRKLLSLLTGFLIGAFILAIGILFSFDDHMSASVQMPIVASLCLLTQLFAGFLVCCTGVYVGEAFPLKAKPYFIATCVIVEQLIQIIVICVLDTSINSTVFIVESVLILVAFAGLCVTMPETRKTSLREAQLRFSPLLDLKMY